MDRSGPACCSNWNSADQPQRGHLDRARASFTFLSSLRHAQVVSGDRKDEDDHHRRHSSLGDLPPDECARQCTPQFEADDSQNVRTE